MHEFTKCMLKIVNLMTLLLLAECFYCSIQDIAKLHCSLWSKIQYSKVYGYSSSQSNLPHRYGNSHAIYRITQRWHSRLYPSQSWYSIKRPRRDARHRAGVAGYILRWYTRPKTVTHPRTNRARRALTSFMRRTRLTIPSRRNWTDRFVLFFR